MSLVTALGNDMFYYMTQFLTNRDVAHLRQTCKAILCMFPDTDELALMRWLNKTARQRPQAESSYRGFCLTYATSLKNSNYAFTWKHEEEDLLYVLRQAPHPIACAFWLLFEDLLTEGQILNYMNELEEGSMIRWFLTSYPSRKRYKTEQGAKRRLNYF